MTHVRILHISDTHFGAHDLEKMSAIEDLARQQEPDIVAVTGDILDSPPFLFMGSSRIHTAKAFLERLRAICSNVFCVAGNHDALLGSTSLSNTWAKLGLQSGSYVRHTRIREHDVIVIGVDSTSFYLRHLNNSGYFDDKQRLYLQKQINSLNNRSSISTDRSLCIALVHHHPLPTNQSQHENMLYFKNSGKFLRFAADNHVRLVLHGHQHDPHYTGISFGQDSGNDVTVVLSAGSCLKREVAQSDRSGCGHLYEIDINNIRSVVRSGYFHHRSGRFRFTDEFSINRSATDEPRMISQDQKFRALKNGDMSAEESRRYVRVTDKAETIVYGIGVDDNTPGCDVLELSVEVDGKRTSHWSFVKDEPRDKWIRVEIPAGHALTPVTTTIRYIWPGGLSRLAQFNGREWGEFLLRGRGIERITVSLAIDDLAYCLDELEVHYGDTPDVKLHAPAGHPIRERGFTITNPRPTARITWLAKVSST